MLYSLIALGRARWVYIFLTTHPTVHLKWEHFTVCKSHLNEVDLKIRIGRFIEMESR